MNGHLSILQALLTERGLSHADVAKALGWESPSTVGNKLRGERRTQLGELAEMAGLVGITVAQLAAMSDDLVLTKHGESVQAAALIDNLPPEKRRLALEMLAAMNQPAKPSQR